MEQANEECKDNSHHSRHQCRKEGFPPIELPARCEHPSFVTHCEPDDYEYEPSHVFIIHLLAQVVAKPDAGQSADRAQNG